MTTATYRPEDLVIGFPGVHFQPRRPAVIPDATLTFEITAADHRRLWGILDKLSRKFRRPKRASKGWRKHVRRMKAESRLQKGLELA